MRQIYYIDTEVFINKKYVNDGGIPIWHYGELPKVENARVIFDFDEAVQYVNSHRIGLSTGLTLFGNKPYITDWYYTFKKKNFEYLKIENKIKVVDTDRYSIKDIQDRLKAEDYIRWYKDKMEDSVMVQRILNE